MKIFIHLTDNKTHDYLKIHAPLQYLRKELHAIGITFLTDSHLTDYYINECDAFWIAGCPQPCFLQQLPKLDNKKVIWLMDDLMTAVEEWNPVSTTIGYSEKETLKTCLDRANLICATTQPLKDYLGYPDKTIVLPNLLDVNKFPAFKKRTSMDTCCWIGGTTHALDLKLLEEVCRLRNDKKFIFFGDLPSGLMSFFRTEGSRLFGVKPNLPNVGYIPVASYDLYQNYIINIKADIGLAPLVDCPFNRCKSNLKFLEYSLLGMLTVASPVAPYLDTIQDGVTGLFVRDNDWVEALALRCERTRADIAENAYYYVRDHFTWQSPARNIWKDMYERIADL